MSTTLRVMIIDDEPVFAASLKSMLTGFGFEVAIAADPVTRDSLNLQDSDIVFVDIRTRSRRQNLCQKGSGQVDRR